MLTKKPSVSVLAALFTIGVWMHPALSQPVAGIASDVHIQCRAGFIAQPSLGQVARRLRASQKPVKNVPLYTNDNLPRSDSGVSILGPSTLRPAAPESSAQASNQNADAAQRISYLRGRLAQAQTRLELHQRELAVLQQKIGQGKMVWYPNPTETLMQEYSRKNVAGLADKVSEKKQTIAQDQQVVEQLTEELQRAQAQFGWVRSAAQAGAPSALPPGLKPGTAQYFEAEIQAAQQQLATAKENVSVTTNEIALLKLQQLRSLNANVQAGLAAQVSERQQELASTTQTVQKAQSEIAALKRKLRHAQQPAK